jgi:hypothetical protein
VAAQALQPELALTPQQLAVRPRPEGDLQRPAAAKAAKQTGPVLEGPVLEGPVLEEAQQSQLAAVGRRERQ